VKMEFILIMVNVFVHDFKKALIIQYKIIIESTDKIYAVGEEQTSPMYVNNIILLFILVYNIVPTPAALVLVSFL